MVRSGEGLLISATARPQQGAGVASTQLDSKEAVGMLKSAAELNKVLADAATQHSALSSKPAGEAQVDFIAQIDPSQKGKFEGSVGGHEALKASEGKREPDPAAPVEKFAQPVVLMEAPASINWATPASTVLFAGGQMQWTTQADMHMAAAFTMTSVSANATGLFTHAGGIQAIAANGPVSLQAHTDQLEILADKAITVISVNDVIEVKASQKIVLQAGQSSVTLEGGNITFACPGNFTVKGGQHLFDGGASGFATFNGPSDATVNLASYPDQFSQLINISQLAYNDPELIGSHYEIWTKGSNGKLLAQGKIDTDALSARVFTETEQELEIIVGDNEWGTYSHMTDEDTDDGEFA
uniref:DUF2345 domain-containing protein n=1 Tax=Tanacetum cinerariifolium TaxID=118510 RepID=A0A6L2N235_TANCI|nr:hypothetical protein [Tanacetum cinerariifolium]